MRKYFLIACLFLCGAKERETDSYSVEIGYTYAFFDVIAEASFNCRIYGEESKECEVAKDIMDVISSNLDDIREKNRQEKQLDKLLKDL